MPPSSPSPSSSSSAPTANARPTRPVSDLSGPLGDIREQLDALRAGQSSTNHMLDFLRDRPIPQNDISELEDLLRRIEDLMQNLVEQGRPRDQIIIEQVPAPQPSPPHEPSERESLAAVFLTHCLDLEAF
jgi:hypothetical protein